MGRGTSVFRSGTLNETTYFILIFLYSVDLDPEILDLTSNGTKKEDCTIGSNEVLSSSGHNPTQVSLLCLLVRTTSEPSFTRTSYSFSVEGTIVGDYETSTNNNDTII